MMKLIAMRLHYLALSFADSTFASLISHPPIEQKWTIQGWHLVFTLVDLQRSMLPRLVNFVIPTSSRYLANWKNH